MVEGNFVSSNQKQLCGGKCRKLKTHEELLSFNHETPKFKHKFYVFTCRSVLNLLL